MLAICLAVASSLGYGAGDFAGGLASRRFGPVRVSIVGSAVATVLSWAVLISSGGPGPTVRAVAWGLASGLAGGTGTLVLYRGLARGQMSVVGPVSAVGAAVGDRAEKSTTEGLPEDEIYVYEDALRGGRSVVVALAENADSATHLREVMKQEGAESVDAAREQWWIGLRSAEESHYSKSGNNFADDEKFYRLGFQAALHAKTRCMEFDQVSGEMNAALEEVQRENPGVDVEEAFTRGYQRGRDYYQQLCDENKKVA